MRLLVVGAGPKAMAVAAKAAVLKSLGLSVPEIFVVERAAVGANWSGENGFTDGRQPLGTPPEKDVGFPYDSRRWGALDAEVNRRMLGFSWQSFLAESGSYGEWIDRGRPAPEHRQWAQYLQWVFGRAGEAVRCLRGEVESFGSDENRWRVGVRVGGESTTEWADGLLLTGPAIPRHPEAIAEDPRILDVESFWKRRGKLEGTGSVVVVGAGEEAAAVCASLLTGPEARREVSVVSPRGMVYSRGEGYQENRLFTDPESLPWSTLTEGDRREFISRTDRGVFSQQALRELTQRGTLRVHPGRLVRVESGPRLTAWIRYGEKEHALETDQLVLATGSDPAALLRRWAEPPLREALARQLGGQGITTAALEANIGEDLALEGSLPPLHLPWASGVLQGPGFANLSCLGRLSDRILGRYVEVP